MRNSNRLSILAAIAFTFLLTVQARAGDDAYFNINLDQLPLTEGKLPALRANNDWQGYGLRESMEAYAVLDGTGDAFAVSGFMNFAATAPENFIAIHTPDHRDVTGRLFLKNGDGTGMVQLRFKIPAASAKPGAKEAFYRTMKDHYERLLNQGVPGAAWFRLRANEARAVLGQKADEGNQGFAPRPAALDDTFSLFSGDQALAENLQLDKALPRTAANPGWKEVDVNSLTGITVGKLDWTPLIKDKKPKLDKLADCIPADQPAIFVPDFASLIALVDAADKYGTPAVQLNDSRAEDAGTRQRYERQLGFSLSGLGRLLGPRLINEVALTASDPYLRAGGDIALLFSPKDGASLKTLLNAQVSAARKINGSAKEVSGKLDNLQYTGSVASDRSLSSYLAEMKDGTIVVSNSLAELSRLASVAAGKTPSLTSVPEYTFFRDRYALGNAEESALVVLSDATIRRWCGAQYRIADSRRTRAAAVLADLNARYMDKLVAGDGENVLIASDYLVPNIGELRLTKAGVVSSTYGSLDFLTPVSELNLQTVTEPEAEAYKRWRDTYETNWRGVFDPIAIRLGVHDTKLSADVTVMPLILNSEYRPVLEITSGAKLNPATFDAHGALLHAGMAINIKSAPVVSVSEMAAGFAPNLKIDPLGWVGQSIWLYADEDPFWAELAKAENGNEFLWKNISRIPIGLSVDVSSGFKLTAFLVALHGFIDQSAPGMTVWQNVTYKDQTYVKISPSEQAKGQNAEAKDAALYYHATGQSLLLTPNEALMKRSIDRQVEHEAAAKEGKAPAAGPALPGESLMLLADGKMYDLFDNGSQDEYQRTMQKRSWGNLPILNEWKRRYPDQDPLKIQERFFHARLVDPAGGEYRWNEKWQTMESTIYGSPAEPKKATGGFALLSGLLKAQFGLTFEHDGLRSRVDLEMGKK